MSNTMIYRWKCNSCESITHHKGLCRSCTDYDTEGKIITPIQRIKIDEDGNEIIKSNKPKQTYIFRDGSEGKRGFRGAKRKTNKQLKLLAEEEAAMLEAIKEVMVKENENEEGIVEIGEVVGEEE
jgi:hypothetical protein